MESTQAICAIKTRLMKKYNLMYKIEITIKQDILVEDIDNWR